MPALGCYAALPDTPRRTLHPPARGAYLDLAAPATGNGVAPRDQGSGIHRSELRFEVEALGFVGKEREGGVGWERGERRRGREEREGGREGGRERGTEGARGREPERERERERESERARARARARARVRARGREGGGESERARARERNLNQGD